MNAHAMKVPLKRRDLFRWLGSGVVMLVGGWHAVEWAQEARRTYPADPNAYLVIRPDGRVTVFSGKIEMGQGVLTSQAQMVAEELGVDLAAIDMVLGDTDRCPWDMGTFGSLTTRMFGPALRAAAAKARTAMLGLASQALRAPRERLEVAHGVVSVQGEPQRRVAYGELAKGARITQTVGRDEVLRAASQFTVMGTSPQRLDAIEKVTGAARFTADMRLPGMLHARLLRPPVHGARLLRVDAAGVTTVPGARWVRDKELMAVLHADPQRAELALREVKAEWERPSGGADTESIFDRISASASPGHVLIERGDVSAARKSGAPGLELAWRKGYVAHAPMETHAALAQVADGKATVWASTQTPFPTRDRIAQALGLPASAVRVQVPYVGGGFGGKSADGHAIEAARLAQLAGRPVMVSRTRQEEFFLDTFDPAAVVRIASGLDGKTGRIAWWDGQVLGCGDRGASLFYDVPNVRITVTGGVTYGPPDASAMHPLAVGPWRAPGANMNVYAIESQMDAMAAQAKADPLEFRMRHLADARMRRVLQAAADAFGWKPAPTPSLRGLGIACSIDAGTYVATIAQVQVDTKSGRVRVLRMVCAQDMGIVVNPTGAKMQVEGGLAMGLGYALSEELRFSGGDILDRNFDSYRIPRFSDVPRIEAVLVRNDEVPPQGGGEPSITTAGGSIANAVFDATGVRMPRLPMTPQRVLSRLSAARGA